jgi:hypothetical protein
MAGGGVLTLTGRNFLGDSPANTLVAFDTNSGITPDLAQPNYIRITLPASLQAGPHAVRVQRTITYPGSTTPHTGLSSDPVVIKLVPTIQGTSPFAAKVGTTFTVTLSPAVGSTQQVKLYIGDNAIPIDERPTTGPASSTTVSFPIPASFPTGLFPLRIEVDGVQSALTLNASNQFTPQVQVSP